MTPERLQEVIDSHPVIQSDNLLLRLPTQKDAQSIFNYASDPDVTKYMHWDTHRSLQDSADFLDRCIESDRRYDQLDFGITLKENNLFVGMCGFHNFTLSHGRTEMGYVLHKDYWGKGIMTEAVSVLLKYGFETLQWHRIQAIARVENIPSQRVMKNVGMQEEGLLRDYLFIKGHYFDYKLFSILKKDFHSEP
ncbi:MAG: GNAT family N-acetyltransferase [Candidatus Marinimicrobia bacterium]|nr:GNAT family N-acetyltransferase [Candidatus Neomarinimicrobiota bacterium]